AATARMNTVSAREPCPPWSLIAIAGSQYDLSRASNACRHLLSVLRRYTPSSLASSFLFRPGGFSSRFSMIPARGNTVSSMTVEPEAGGAVPNTMDREELFNSLYDELHRLARREVYRRGRVGGLGVTTVLHEAYLSISRNAGAEFVD